MQSRTFKQLELKQPL